MSNLTHPHISQTFSLIIVVVVKPFGLNPKLFGSSDISFMQYFVDPIFLVKYLNDAPPSIEHHFPIIPPFLLGGDSAAGSDLQGAAWQEKERGRREEGEGGALMTERLLV